MTHSYVWHDSFIFVTWLIYKCDSNPCIITGTPSFPFKRATHRIHMCDMTHSYVWHDSFICVTRLIHTCDTTHSYVWHDSFICVTRLIHMQCANLILQKSLIHCNALPHTATHCNTLQHTATHCHILQHTATHCNQHTWILTNSVAFESVCVSRGSVCTKTSTRWSRGAITKLTKLGSTNLSVTPRRNTPTLHTHTYTHTFICVTWLIHMCDMTHSYVWHDSFICVTWFIHKCDMTHSYVQHDAFICVTWRIHIWDMTHSHVRHASLMSHSYMWHDSFICGTCLSFMCVTWLIHMRHHAIGHWGERMSRVSWHNIIFAYWDMEWLRSVGSKIL